MKATLNTSNFTWHQIITGAFALVSASTTATYFLTSQSRQSELIALKEQVATATLQVSTANLRTEILDRRSADLEKRLDAYVKSGQQPSNKQSRDSSVSPGLPKIRISSPTKGGTVRNTVDVVFELGGVVPKGVTPVLVVRDPLGQLWSWGQSPSDRWYGVQIGTAADIGKQFEIRAILSDHPIPPSGTISTLPPALASDSIEVTRR